MFFVKNPDDLSKKKQYQQGFAVIYLVAAVVLASTIFDDYNVFLVGVVVLMVYYILKYLVGVYAEKKSE
ncbi:hypothetical protein GCM10010954_21580 [Halobacillus andaensis]|uniref:Uncharacterized protein n=1 Tax=Halobacillus andaensis TaxID=1176239 RepID=A0A917EVJ9_HALAA|nr:hypothetical protein [Halobacillus andaensis]MBP2004333.1 hypothetical protein [Halobacillus andaensis]GGF22458.1 hypothetical protein GCM10010954_21580 [Halobacillus andaensis]